RTDSRILFVIDFGFRSCGIGIGGHRRRERRKNRGIELSGMQMAKQSAEASFELIGAPGKIKSPKLAVTAGSGTEGGGRDGGCRGGCWWWHRNLLRLSIRDREIARPAVGGAGRLPARPCYGRVTKQGRNIRIRSQ